MREDSELTGIRIVSVRNYPESLREKAVAAVEERRRSNPRDRTIYREIAQKYDVGEQSLRLWVKKQHASSPTIEANGPAPKDEMMTSEEMREQLDSMRKKIEQLQAENDVLKRAFVVFSTEWSK